MRSKRKIFLICSAILLVSALTPVLLSQSSADASENLKESSIEELSKDSTQTVEISTAATYTNDFEITEDGSLAKDKAAEMLERYPTLNANPYALLVKFDDSATPQELSLIHI